MHTVSAERVAFAFRPDIEPALRVAPGETVRFETSAAPIERLLAAGDRWLEQFDANEINALSGPVFIEGVRPGDAVAVEIIAVEPAGWGWTAFGPGFSDIGGMPTPTYLRRFPIRDGKIELSPERSLPVRPMIGCLGLAPASGASSSLAPPFPWGGNYDLTQVSAGSTILFPAQVAGGLFSLGDLHAAMGAGEAAGIAIECAGSATVRFGVRPGLTLRTPRIETPDRLFTIGLDPNRNLDRARRQALALLVAYLTDERGLSAEDAVILIAAAADLEFGGPAAAVVLASVPWAALPVP